MNKNLIKILSLLILCCLAQIASAQKISAIWSVPPPKVLDAGNTYTIALKLANNSTESKQVKTLVELPSNWLALSTANELTEIPSKDSLVVLITFRAPSSALARSYPLKIELMDENDAIFKTYRHVLKVKRGFKVTIENLTDRKFVTSDENFTNTFQVVNRSNISLELKVKTRNAKNMGFDTLYLKSGESQKIEISVKAPQSFSKIRNHVYGIIVKSEDFDTIVSSISNIEVYPSNKYKEDKFQRFPVSLALNYLGRETNGEYIEAFQGELFARGSISESKNDQLEIKLKGPDRVQYSLFGNYDEYYTRYTNSKVKLWVGDQSLRVTELTERGRFVRGITGSYRIKRFEITGFYGKSRFLPGLKDEYGAKLEYSLNNKLTLGAATLFKNFEGVDSSAIIPTIYLNYNSNTFRFKSELAYGVNGPVDGYAFNVSAVSNIGKLKLSARALNADRFFPGFLNNSQILAFGSNYRFDKTQIGLNANYRNSNPALDTFFVAAPISYNILFNVVHRFNTITSLEFRAGQTRRTDRFEPKRFDYTEFVNRIAFKQDFEHWNYSFYTEVGRNNNFLLPEGNNISASYTGGVETSVSLSGTFRASGNFIVQNTNRYALERTTNLISGARLFWRYGSDSRISVGYRNNYAVEDIYQTQDQLQLTLDNRIARNHSVSISARYAKPRGQTIGKSLFINAKYVYTFDMPVKRKKVQGKILGRIVVQDSIPVEGARLRISRNKSISEEDGVFIFPKLAYGIYYLSIDRSSIGIDQVSEQTMPIKVEVSEENKNPNVNIKIVTAGHIKGNIMYPKIKNQLLDTKSKKFRPVYIEINNGKERHIQPCDTLGDFSFEYIRPGKWKVRLIESTLDDNFIYNKTKTTIDIKPGEARTLNFKARRKQKQLRMISPPIKLTAKSKVKNSGGTK